MQLVNYLPPSRSIKLKLEYRHIAEKRSKNIASIHISLQLYTNIFLPDTRH